MLMSTQPNPDVLLYPPPTIPPHRAERISIQSTLILVMSISIPAEECDVACPFIPYHEAQAILVGPFTCGFYPIMILEFVYR